FGDDVPQVIPELQTEAVPSTELKREYSLREPSDLECGEDVPQVIPELQTEAAPSTETKRELSLREPHDLGIPSDGLEINDTEPDEPDMRFEAFVDGRHFETVAGQMSPIHDHCWQVKIAVEVPTNNPNYASYGKVFKAINSTLTRYEDVLLNEVFPFELIEPSLENVAMYFFNCLDDTLCLMDLIIKEITVWENSDSCLKVNSRNRSIDALLYKGEDLLEDIRSRLNAQNI
ncbi:MAG: 6-carboxytetrahydropterin synthase, partial [Firmicutes bacterium]|nr:6-carboxytetrahydropterin synthase [Bacillota bacterium]